MTLIFVCSVPARAYEPFIAVGGGYRDAADLPFGLELRYGRVFDTYFVRGGLELPLYTLSLDAAYYYPAGNVKVYAGFGGELTVLVAAVGIHGVAGAAYREADIELFIEYQPTALIGGTGLNETPTVFNEVRVGATFYVSR